MVEVIEPSVTHSDFIHQMEVKESVPAEIFANMNNLDDCFENSQIESRAWKTDPIDNWCIYFLAKSSIQKVIIN